MKHIITDKFKLQFPEGTVSIVLKLDNRNTSVAFIDWFSANPKHKGLGFLALKLLNSYGYKLFAKNAINSALGFWYKALSSHLIIGLSKCHCNRCLALANSNLEIKISPFNIECFYLCRESSYRYGITQGTIYTPRLSSNLAKTAEYSLNSDSDKFQWIIESINHECLHKEIAELFDYEVSTQLDNIDKSLDSQGNEHYVISKIDQLTGEQLRRLKL